MSSPSATPTPASITVIIKNPANNGNVDYSTEVPLGWTVGQLKFRIAREYVGNPLTVHAAHHLLRRAPPRR